MITVVRKIPFLRALIVLCLVLWLFYHYFVAPVARTIDRFTPWDGIIPGAYSCGAQPTVRGWPGLFHDTGAAFTSIRKGPPSYATMVGWYHTAGVSGAQAVSYIKDGAAGRAVTIPLAPSVVTPGALSDARIAQLAAQAGWPAAEIHNVISRVQAESSGVPTARDHVTGTHWGLLQLGAAERAQYIPAHDAFDPLWNLRGARALWTDRGWAPWKASDGMVKTVAAAPCTPDAGTVSTAYTNGALPASALRPISVGGRLQSGAATAFEAMNMAYSTAFGTPIEVTDSYRDLAGQYAVAADKPGLAARPGTSQHGLGLALDLGGGIQSFGTPQYQWMKSNAPRFGWIHPTWAETTKPEPWHWEFKPVQAAG